MPSWWVKLSSMHGKHKSKKESFINVLNRKLCISSAANTPKQSEGTRGQHNDSISERGFRTQVASKSSALVSRSQSFSEGPLAQPLPLPSANIATIGRTDSEISRVDKTEIGFDSKRLLVSPPLKPVCADNPDAEGDFGTASISSGSSIDTDDPSDFCLLSPLTSDYENGTKTSVNSPSSIELGYQSAVNRKNTSEPMKPASVSINNQDKQILPTSLKQRHPCTNMRKLQIPQRGVPSSAPESSISSPSRSPVRSFTLDPGVLTGKPRSVINLLGSGQCSSPGSGFNSGHNSIGGDFSGQLLWPQSRCSPECSPVPSPRRTSPGPSSRIHSGAVTPLHPRAGGPSSESPLICPEDSRQQSHRLPLPPLTISNTSPVSPNYSAATSPTVPRSPARTETPASPGSRWKKGRLLGRGTFGHVYLGFDRESGEMCAMKEVTLFPDDNKSKESAKQLGQEIAMLSRLRHPNIVQYYGSETIDDKLYIYLEYVSGGSIFKLLQEYGKFGENAIRNYTQQILSGLAYLHTKNTIHRDIKGANILVDPCGRVKLADFGMAKHITGQYCPLSFKGSPYWMAPEVIKNANGCNLAVDIWSLGCTVLEMATTKPPWSQYEGVAAMFKIGNSKELPEIPDHLSDEGKDFIWLCLQRDPSVRPSAAQLLEHPFVKNGAPLDRHVIRADNLEVTVTVSDMTRSTGIGNARNLLGFDSEDTGNHQPKGVKIPPGTSDSPTPRNMSCPISPVGGSILRPRSPQHMSGGRLSPSISSSCMTSGTVTPLGGGVSFHLQEQQPGIDLTPRLQNSFYGCDLYQEHNDPDLSRRQSQPARVLQEMISSGQGEPENFSSHLQRELADHVSQHLLNEQLSFNQFIDPKSRWLMASRASRN